MSDDGELIARLEAEYDLETGFIGQFDHGAFDRMLALLRSIDFGEADTINRRVVALLWLIPTIMGYQLQRVEETGGDAMELQRSINRVEAILDDVLGMPCTTRLLGFVLNSAVADGYPFVSR